VKRSPRLRIVTLVCLVAGLALLVPFDATITLALGVALLLAFVVCGVFLIADPAFLEGDEDGAGS
jgi:hypothetical protein